MHEGQLRQVDDWTGVSEKVGMERSIYKGELDGQKTETCKSSGEFEVSPSVDWKPVKPVHEVLNRRRT